MCSQVPDLKQYSIRAKFILILVTVAGSLERIWWVTSSLCISEFKTLLVWENVLSMTLDLVLCLWEEGTPCGEAHCARPSWHCHPTPLNVYSVSGQRKHTTASSTQQERQGRETANSCHSRLPPIGSNRWQRSPQHSVYSKQSSYSTTVPSVACPAGYLHYSLAL